jgi:hypothetical protein
MRAVEVRRWWKSEQEISCPMSLTQSGNAELHVATGLRAPHGRIRPLIVPRHSPDNRLIGRGCHYANTPRKEESHCALSVSAVTSRTCNNLAPPNPGRRTPSLAKTLNNWRKRARSGRVRADREWLGGAMGKVQKRLNEIAGSYSSRTGWWFLKRSRCSLALFMNLASAEFKSMALFWY